ncbi:arylamine N-acetyltransferase family protein [Paenibacillus sp. Soil724D2]|uniref:arylamine N-acetyltransferase family protein n=1 Tax=Paenibacillus sp. (strain Soil724D2) TaxID=1736392 RepID=UPI0007147AA7|nr:arylamine N-acetyltransferase [Paenibacillus sp. Soil724D2]KRE48912.1 arylamine N-acetyltransferase [Paenibacillus sp. Soil724D2]
MYELNGLFRKRMGIPENQKITFETLDHILRKTALSLPFENLSIISNKTSIITKESLITKMLVKNEGGLCYQLNPLLYFFLVENGFNAALVRGEVYNYATKDWSKLGRTHVTILLQHKGQTYLVDTGFGGNLPLKPVPLNGETTSSVNGEFRVKAMESDYGDYVLELKLKYKDTDWKIGYAFDTKRPLENLSELNEVQGIIVQHKESRFNKTPLITQLTSDGNVTLTDTSFTQWMNGKSSKEQIDNVKFKELAKQHFGFQEL